jgi:hypothetical protein
MSKRFTFYRYFLKKGINTIDCVDYSLKLVSVVNIGVHVVKIQWLVVKIVVLVVKITFLVVIVK